MNANPDALTNNGGNDMVSAVTAMGYDAYFTALEAIKAAGSAEPADVLAALPSVSYEGVSGLIEFDEIGDAKRDAAYIKTANTETGEWGVRHGSGASSKHRPQTAQTVNNYPT